MYPSNMHFILLQCRYHIRLFEHDIVLQPPSSHSVPEDLFQVGLGLVNVWYCWIRRRDGDGDGDQ